MKINQKLILKKADIGVIKELVEERIREIEVQKLLGAEAEGLKKSYRRILTKVEYYPKIIDKLEEKQRCEFNFKQIKKHRRDKKKQALRDRIDRHRTIIKKEKEQNV